MDTLVKVKQALQSGHEGHLARYLRCVPSYTDNAVRSEVSVLPNRRNNVHVHGPTIWIDNGPVGVHGSSQADQEVDDPPPVRFVSVPRRLAQRPPEQGCADPQNGRASATLSPTRFAGEGGEIGTSSLALNHISRGTTGSSSGQGLSDPGESRWDQHGYRANFNERGCALPAGRLSVGYTSSDNSDGSTGTVKSPSTPTTGNTESEEGAVSAHSGSR